MGSIPIIRSISKQSRNPLRLRDFSYLSIIICFLRLFKILKMRSLFDAPCKQVEVKNAYMKRLQTPQFITLKFFVAFKREIIP